MAEQYTIDRYPQYASQIHELAEQHLALQDEPLHLAMVYDPGVETDDIYLFEVVENFGNNSVDPDRQLFEVAFGSIPAFPMAEGTQLHMIITNPIEAKQAIEEDWPHIQVIRNAVRSGRYERLKSTQHGDEVLRRLRE